MYFEFYPMGEGSGHDIQSDNWPDAISECQYYQPCAWNPVDRTDCFIKRRWNCWICSSGPVRPGRLTGLEVCLWRNSEVSECAPHVRLLRYTGSVRRARETSKMTQTRRHILISSTCLRNPSGWAACAGLPIGMLVMPSPELRFEAADAPSRFRAGIRLTEIVLSFPTICARGQVARTANAQYEAIRFSTCPDR